MQTRDFNQAISDFLPVAALGNLLSDQDLSNIIDNCLRTHSCLKSINLAGETSKQRFENLLLQLREIAAPIPPEYFDLYLAVMLNRTALAIHLLSQLTQPDYAKLVIARDIHGYSLLAHSILTEQELLVMALLNIGADVNEGCSFDTFNRATPITLACCVKNSEIITLLVEKGANLNAVVNEKGQTPLFLIPHQNFVTLFTLFLENGANPYHTYTEPAPVAFWGQITRTFITTCSKLSDAEFELVFSLIANKDPSKWLLLVETCILESCLTDDVRALRVTRRNYKTDINSYHPSPFSAHNPNRDFFTLLHLACAGGAVNCFTHLLQQGADMKLATLHLTENMQPQFHYTGVHLAAFAHSVRILGLVPRDEFTPLLAVPTHTLDTPLHCAMTTSRNHVASTMTNLLLSIRPEDILATNRRGITPMHLAFDDQVINGRSLKADAQNAFKLMENRAAALRFITLLLQQAVFKVALTNQYDMEGLDHQDNQLLSRCLNFFGDIHRPINDLAKALLIEIMRDPILSTAINITFCHGEGCFIAMMKDCPVELNGDIPNRPIENTDEHYLKWFQKYLVVSLNAWSKYQQDPLSQLLLNTSQDIWKIVCQYLPHIRDFVRFSRSNRALYNAYKNKFLPSSGVGVLAEENQLGFLNSLRRQVHIDYRNVYFDILFNSFNHFFKRALTWEDCHMLDAIYPGERMNPYVMAVVLNRHRHLVRMLPQAETLPADKIPNLRLLYERRITLFAYACNHNMNKTVQALLPVWKRVSNLNDGTLHKACERLNIELIKTLLEGGADPNIAVNYCTPLFIVITAANNALEEPIHHRACEAVKMLLAHQVMLETIDAHNTCTALYYALKFNLTDIAELLLEAGARFDLPGNANPVMAALFFNNLTFLRSSVDKSTDPVELRHKYFFEAIKTDDLRIIDLFTQANQNFAETPLHAAMRMNCTAATRHYLTQGDHPTYVSLLNEIELPHTTRLLVWQRLQSVVLQQLCEGIEATKDKSPSHTPRLSFSQSQTQSLVKDNLPEIFRLLYIQCKQPDVNFVNLHPLLVKLCTQPNLWISRLIEHMKAQQHLLYQLQINSLTSLDPDFHNRYLLLHSRGQTSDPKAKLLNAQNTEAQINILRDQLHSLKQLSLLGTQQAHQSLQGYN